MYKNEKCNNINSLIRASKINCDHAHLQRQRGRGPGGIAANESSLSKARPIAFSDYYYYYYYYYIIRSH